VGPSGSESDVEQKRSTLETTTEARQGVTGHNVRYVLFASCALAVVFMIVAFLFVGK
jgi:hypothetical protein